MKRVVSAGDVTNVIGFELDDNVSDKDDRGFTQVHNRRKRACRKATTSATTTTTARNQSKKVVAGTSSSSTSNSQVTQLTQLNNPDAADLDLDLRQLQKTLQDLRATIQSQNDTILQLSRQLQYVVSFLTGDNGQLPAMQSHLLAGDTGTDTSTDQGSTNDNNNASGATGVPNSKTVQRRCCCSSLCWQKKEWGQGEHFRSKRYCWICKPQRQRHSIWIHCALTSSTLISI